MEETIGSIVVVWPKKITYYRVDKREGFPKATRRARALHEETGSPVTLEEHLGGGCFQPVIKFPVA